MIDKQQPSEVSLKAGYEVRDVWIAIVVAVAIGLLLLVLFMEFFLWWLSREVVPEQKVPGASPPVVMPGEAPVNDRIRAVPHPRLDSLVPLESVPPSYRSSRPVPASAAMTQRPQDLWAVRHPELHIYGWIEPGKTARIPIDLAMDAIVEAKQTVTSDRKRDEK